MLLGYCKLFQVVSSCFKLFQVAASYYMRTRSKKTVECKRKAFRVSVISAMGLPCLNYSMHKEQMTITMLHGHLKNMAWFATCKRLFISGYL